MRIVTQDGFTLERADLDPAHPNLRVRLADGSSQVVLLGQDETKRMLEALAHLFPEILQLARRRERAP